MLWKSCSKFNFLQVFHSMFCKKIDILAVAKEKLCIATIFIRGIKHLEIVIDIEYQYYQTIFRYKKAFLRFGCLCSNATVALILNDSLANSTFHSCTLRIDFIYSGIRAKTTKTEESFFVSKYGLIVLIFDIYDYL